MSVPLTEPSVSTVTVELAVAAFLESLAGKSPRTRVTYASALRRLLEHLEAGGIEPASTPAEQLPPDLLERFYGWLVRAIMRRAAIRSGRPTSGDHEYTDWNAVDDFARKFLAEARRRAA